MCLEEEFVKGVSKQSRHLQECDWKIPVGVMLCCNTEEVRDVNEMEHIRSLVMIVNRSRMSDGSLGAEKKQNILSLYKYGRSSATP